MNKTTSTLLLGSFLALGIGTFGISNSFSASQPAALESNAAITGHITLTATDQSGNVIAYRQTDNAVLNRADNCISEKIFTLTTGNGCSTDASPYTRIHIGTGSNATTPSEAWTQLVLPMTYNSDVAATTSALTNATDTGGASTLLTASFTNVNANINEAAIRNGAGGSGVGDVLAYQQFTAINLGATDNLTIAWTVTIDGN
jgi:hypothetical protein